jgi:hypothetical protein
MKKENLDFSKHFNTDADYKELFKSVGMPGYKIIKNKNIQTSKDSLISIVSTVDSKTGDNKKILVYGIIGEPIFKQLLEVGYDHGSDIDVRIIMFYHPGESKFEFMNNKHIAEHFVDIFNDCHQDIYLIDIIGKKEDINGSNSFSEKYQFKIITGPDSDRKTSFRKLPSKRNFQVGEIWNYCNDYLGLFDIPLECESPSCLVGGNEYQWEEMGSQNINVTNIWNEKGIILSAITGDKNGKNYLKDIYENKLTELETIFRNYKIKFRSEKGTFRLIIEIDTRPVTDFFDCSDDEKCDFVQILVDSENGLVHFIHEYFNELETKVKSA